MRTTFLLLVAALQFGCNSSKPIPAPAEPTAEEPTASTSRIRPRHVFDLDGNVIEPFATVAKARVFVFVTTDCPIANRYAPELQRMAQDFAKRDVEMFLVYPNASDTREKIRQHLAEYSHTATALCDTNHTLVRQAQATVTPQAAVFDANDNLVYSGRIDNWYVDFGKNRTQATTHELRDAVTATLEDRPIASARVKAIGCYIPELD
jgi:hypothetical protein